MHARTRRRLWLVVWLGLPGLSALGSAGLAAALAAGLVSSPLPRLGLLAALLTGAVTGLLAGASVLWGDRLLDDPAGPEPVRFREAAWLLGVPPGLLHGVLTVLNQPPAPNPKALLAPWLETVLVTALCWCVAWALQTRLLVRGLRLAMTDHACAAVRGRRSYRLLLARRIRATRRQGQAPPMEK